jgi:glycosyltransferase involved in cell wall biosynthesis
MQKLLHIYPVEAPFIDKDIDFLSKKYLIQRVKFNSKNRTNIFLALFDQIVYLVKNRNNYTGIIIMFAGVHSFFPVMISRLLRKKSIIIPGGTDCVSFPSINYGNFNSKTLIIPTKFSYRNTNLILPVHESLIKYEYNYNDENYKYQGILFHYPNLKTKMKVIVNGYDSTKWYKNTIKENNTFITVASYSNNERRRQLKGIDLIIDLAKIFKDQTFTIIGTDPKSFPKHTDNIILLPWVNNTELITYYSQSTFYLQLSMSEGFPNSLCEAMLCECVPIVSNVASMPFIVEDSGFVLVKKDFSMLVDLINKAILCDTETLGKKARARIAHNFTEEARAEKLVALVSELIN